LIIILAALVIGIVERIIDQLLLMGDLTEFFPERIIANADYYPAVFALKDNKGGDRGIWNMVWAGLYSFISSILSKNDKKK